MTTKQETGCCIAGGGPAGMMLGLLLARAGVPVVVLEKHADFLRDFRGDTIHPSTLELMYELGLLEEFLARPHDEAPEIRAVVGGEEVIIADFTKLSCHCKFIALMPQWDFLDFLADEAKKYPGFELRMETDVEELLWEDGRVVGVRATAPDGPLEIRAPLTVGADGRHSTVREQSGLVVEDLGAPIDALWMRISRLPSDPTFPSGRIDRGLVFVTINRGDYWQCAYVIPKDGYARVKERGLVAFQADLLRSAPFLGERVKEIDDWSQVKLLTVTVDRLKTWHKPGLLCIGDAAHAMSPVGGVGINLAIQDAVAAANLLTPSLRAGLVESSALARVQARREFAARATQWMQVQIHKRFLGKIVDPNQPAAAPGFVRWFRRIPALRRIPAQLVGIGIRPEHVDRAG